MRGVQINISFIKVQRGHRVIKCASGIIELFSFQHGKFLQFSSFNEESCDGDQINISFIEVFHRIIKSFVENL